MWWRYKPYINVAQRRAKAAKQITKMAASGQSAQPVHIEGFKIARTFWGKAWCDNLESYSDYSNRLPRGRTYVRNGSVCDLKISPGQVTALVCGSELYEISISIARAKSACWNTLKRDCAGQIGAVIELLQGRLSESVMRIITRQEGGLFPRPSEIKLECSCPDSAGMCKHVAATLYGVGARLDQQPELLFLLRQVDHLELITDAAKLDVPGAGKSGRKTIAAADLSDVFGIELSATTSVESVNSKGIERAASTRKTPRRSKFAASSIGGRAHDKKAHRLSEPRKAASAKSATVIQSRRLLKKV